MDQPRLGRPYPVENAPNPLQHLHASPPPPQLSAPNTPSSTSTYSSASSSTSEPNGLALCPSSPPRDAGRPPAARPLPYLPLELQMMIIRDTIELYRQDEKRASPSGGSGAKAGKTASEPSAAQRLARIVGLELETAEDVMDLGSGRSDWSFRKGTMAFLTEGDRHPDEEVEETGKWGLALVSRTVRTPASSAPPSNPCDSL